MNSSYIIRRKMENSPTCDICNVDVHRASYAKLLRSEKHLKNEKQYELIIPEWLVKEEEVPIEKQIKKVYNPKTLKKIARATIKLNDKELDKEIAKKMINPYYCIDKNLKIGLKINQESQNVNHANSLLKITPNFPDIRTEARFFIKILREMANVYARLINQNIFENHILF